ncbi:DUF6455 family protein [Rhodovibrionaceae bacterium A322]
MILFEIIAIVVTLTALTLLPTYLMALQRRFSRPVMLGAYLVNQGVNPGILMNQGMEEAMARRARRCMGCNHYKECCSRLSREETANLSDICANQDFIDAAKAA